MLHRIIHRGGMAAFAFLVFTVMPGRGVQPQKDKDVVYVSPDRALRSRVHTDSNAESRVQIEDARKGGILLLRDDTSRDGEHGRAVVHGAWTPDSQFFVASVQSSGGHQPWAHPIWVYSRDSNHVVELWRIGLTVVANFQLRSPDILKTRVLTAGGNGRRAGQALSVGLRTLLSKGR